MPSSCAKSGGGLVGNRLESANGSTLDRLPVDVPAGNALEDGDQLSFR